MSFNAFWHCCTNRDVVLVALKASKDAIRTNTGVFLRSSIRLNFVGIGQSAYQTSPVTAWGVPGPLVHSSLANITTLHQGSVICWPHNTDPHIKYVIRHLKLHRYAAVPSTGAKVVPTSQTLELMCS